MAMPENLQLEAFSRAYVHAVAAVGGYATQDYVPDIDKVDLTIAARGPMGTSRSPKLDIQLKGTASDLGDAENLAYDLDVATFENLRQTDYPTSRILVVVIVPERVEEWLAQDAQQLALRRCGYWYCLSGQGATDNEATIRLAIPRRQIFSVAALTGLLRGELPEVTP